MEYSLTAGPAFRRLNMEYQSAIVTLCYLWLTPRGRPAQDATPNLNDPRSRPRPALRPFDRSYRGAGALTGACMSHRFQPRRAHVCLRRPRNLRHSEADAATRHAPEGLSRGLAVTRGRLQTGKKLASVLPEWRIPTINNDKEKAYTPSLNQSSAVMYVHDLYLSSQNRFRARLFRLLWPFFASILTLSFLPSD